MPSVSEQYLDHERRVSAGLEGLRTDVAWIKRLAWTAVAGIGVGCASLVGQAWYMGSLVGRVETAVASLERGQAAFGDELRALRQSDERIAAALGQIRTDTAVTQQALARIEQALTRQR